MLEACKTKLEYYMVVASLWTLGLFAGVICIIGIVLFFWTICTT